MKLNHCITNNKYVPMVSVHVHTGLNYLQVPTYVVRYSSHLNKNNNRNVLIEYN